MSFVTDVADSLSKEIVTFVEIELDYCPLAYGSANCGASGALANACYQTFQTCHNVVDETDPANVGYTGINGLNQLPRPTKKYWFFNTDHRDIDFVTGLPDVVYGGLNSVTPIPTKIDREKGLGRRSTITANFQDFQDDDSDTDQYASSRNYDTSQGSFWGKFLARNDQAYYGRPFRVYTGVKKDVFDLADYEKQEYVIQQIDRNSRGTVSVKANDPLYALNDAVLPAVTKAAVNIETLASHTTEIDVFDKGNFQEQLEPLLDLGVDPSMVTDTTYATVKLEHIRSGSEIISFTHATYRAVGDGYIELTGITRGAKGTEAADLSEDDDVQLCYTYTDNPVNVIYDMLVQFTDSDFIDYDIGGGATTTDEADWEYQRFLYLNLAQSDNVISKPTKVYDLTADLANQYNAYLWWSDREQKIRLKSLAPPVSSDQVKALTSLDHIAEDSVSNKNDLTTQFTQIHVYYDRIDYTEDKKESNYRKLVVYVDSDVESEYSFDRSKAKVIFADNILADADADRLGVRKLGLICKGDKRYTLTISSDNADVWVGDYVSIETFDIQTPTGRPLVEVLEVLSAKFLNNKQLQLEATASFLGNITGGTRFFYWSPAAASQTATWADDDGDEVEADGVTKVLDEDGNNQAGWSWF